MAKGYFALLLHAHLPFVRHPEYPDFLEEDWLFEAITETYIPLWQVFRRIDPATVFISALAIIADANALRHAGRSAPCAIAT